MNLRLTSDKGTSLSVIHLDAIRGFAALIVLVGHARVLFLRSITGEPQNNPLTTPLSGLKTGMGNLAASTNSIGHEAVMVFFVLSGFLVGGSVLKLMKKNRWSWKDYLLKRMTRLWLVLIPALLLGTILDHAGMYIFTNPHSIYTAPPEQTLVVTDLSSRFSPKIMLGNLVFLQNISVPTAGSNVALWSLANEFWYYMAFPLLVLALSRKRGLWQRAIFIVLFAGILAGIGGDASRLFLVWLLGVVVSMVPLKASKRVAKWGTVCFAVILSVAVIWVKQHIVNIATAEFTIGLLCACLLYFMLHQKQNAKNSVYSRASVFTSRISYTLYLVHLPILIFLCACINNPWHVWPSTLMNLAITLAICGLTIGLAFAFYLLFEANTDELRNLIAQKITATPMKGFYRPQYVP
jgi:peptidoglycan/LPS O-acetylase OafA/YrhL